uniref:Reverse transcriptase domain-containing protein n=1 Tax=Scophthalmus maximus TaxID=52904 RepID=A0A8D3C548_SCOMX
MLPLGNIIRKRHINFHCYADDTQLYLSIKPDETNQVDKLQDCLKDIKAWMTYNFLLLNSEKTEVIILGPKHLRETLSDHIVTLDGITLASSSTVRNLGVTFDQDMSFDSHIKQVSRTAFFHLRNIKYIRNILSQKDAEKLVHAFVTSRLDYCNSLLLGCPNKSVKSLQLIQNAAARVLTGTRKRDHISPVLESLHWLTVKFRIEFKILLLTYKHLDNQAPSYLTELLVSYYPNRSLRSVNAGLLWFPESVKVEWEAEPSATRLLSSGTSSQFVSGMQIPCLHLKLNLKPSFLIKLIVRTAQVFNKTFLYYAVIGLDCWGNLYHEHLSPSPVLSFSLSLSLYISLLLPLFSLSLSLSAPMYLHYMSLTLFSLSPSRSDPRAAGSKSYYYY